MTGLAGKLAALFWVMGAVTIATTWWDSGNQPTAATQLPAVLVAAGAGGGLVALACLLRGVERARERQVRLEAVLTEAIGARSAGLPVG